MTVLIFKASCKKQRIPAQLPARREEQVFDVGIAFA